VEKESYGVGNGKQNISWILETKDVEIKKQQDEYSSVASKLYFE
jgi:hypothetical protein